MRGRRRGFTLLELILVLAILVMLAAVAYPTVEGTFRHVKLQTGADAVRAALMQARAHAIDEARPYRFAVVPGQGNFRVAPDSSEFWQGGSPSTAAMVLESTLPSPIPFVLGTGEAEGTTSNASPASSGSVDPGAWVPVVTFLPDGTATDDRDITLRLPGSRPVVVHLRSLTGTVTVH